MEKVLQNKNTPFYVFDKIKFQSTLDRLKQKFTTYYDKFCIAYSYKTNYTPAICKAAYENGTLAEIVSDMEGYIATNCGVPYSKIIFNGPYKYNYEKYLRNGSTIIIDNGDEAETVYNFAINNAEVSCKIAFRLNYEVVPNKISRFGFDVLQEEIRQCICKLKTLSNVKIVGIHCHIGGARGLYAWITRAKKMLDLAFSLFDGKLEFVDLGSGMFGEMEEELASQFASNIPTFDDYAKAVGGLFAERFKDYSYEDKPFLYVEPGTTVVANAVSFYAKVIAIKEIRGKKFAILNCSSQNLGVLSTKKDLPITVFNAKSPVEEVDFVGYTCIEADCFYRGYTGNLDVGSVVEFRNVGSYSVNMKPPFIMPNCEMYQYDSCANEMKIIKEKEEYDKLLSTYVF